MARKYVKTGPVPAVTDAVLRGAQDRVKDAAARLREAGQADPASPGWDGEYDAAAAGLAAAERRLEAVERLRAAQVERGGQREAAVKASAGELAAIASGLAASRDKVAAAAAAHLAALAELGAAVDDHNRLLGEGRARTAALGLLVVDDLLDEGDEHAEGAFGRTGLRAGGTDWTPVPPGALEAHALRQVFSACSPLHPLAGAGRYTWRAHEVLARPDGLRVPVLKPAEAPAAPRRAPARRGGAAA